jgi:hypothetical protein
MAAHRVAWKNDKHVAQWVATLQTYAYPLLGDVSLQSINTALIMKVIPVAGKHVHEQVSAVGVRPLQRGPASSQFVAKRGLARQT